MRHKEDNTQKAFFEWCQRKHYNGKPLSKVCHAIPNGGKRNAREAARMKRQGVLAGVADVFLAIASGCYHGLYIEFKEGDNKLSEYQAEFKKNVTENGYLFVTCYSVEDAVFEVEVYLSKDTIAIPACIFTVVDTQGKVQHIAKCRRMSKTFKTHRGAVGWLRRRGFDEGGNRI